MLFKKKIHPVITKPLNRIKPIDGLMITDGENYWFIKGGKRVKCFSYRSFKSWSLDAILATPQACKTIPLTGTLGFRDGSLIKDVVSGKIYLVSSSKTRLVTNPDILDIIGRDKIIEVGPEEIAIHNRGEDLNGWN
jgi:hypothetical protein